MSVTPLELLSNYPAESTLSADITDSATSLTVQTGQGSRFRALAAGQRYRARLLHMDAGGVVISHEIVRVTAKAGDVFTIERGQEGTANVAHAAGTQFAVVLTAYQANQLRGHATQPRANRLLARSFDPLMAQRSVQCQPAAGRVVLARIEAPEDLPLTFFKTALRIAGVTIANCFAGAYSKGGVLLGKTANQNGVWTATGVIADAALVAEAGQSLTIPGGEDEFFYGAVLIGSAGTMPGFYTTHAETGLTNIGVGATDPPRVGISVDTTLTALPASINPLIRSGGGMGLQNDSPFIAFG